MAIKFSDLNGIQKAAILLITLGPERSANVFKHLKEDEIEQLTLEIANTRSVTPNIKEEVLEEFYEVCLAQQYVTEGGISYANDLLEKSFGSEKAKEINQNLTALEMQLKQAESTVDESYKFTEQLSVLYEKLKEIDKDLGIK